MQTTITSSCYDAIVIKQQNRTYRSTPFQVVFSSNLIKQIQKNTIKKKPQPYKLTFSVNDRQVDVAVRIDKTGRVVFQKIYNRKMSSMVSDSSDLSDQDYSHKSSNYTLDTRKSKGKGLHEKLQQYKNEHAPSKFWQFAWLFNHKKQQPSPAPNLYNMEQDLASQSNLTKIKQQVYQGEEHSKQPLFHLSLCGSLLKKKQSKEDILRTFYQHRVEYSQFIKDPPGFINDSNLVVKIDESIYTWQLGIAILTCRFAYGRDLSKEEIEDIIKTKFTKSRLFSFISGGSNVTKFDLTQLGEQIEAVKTKQLRRIKQKQQAPVIKFRKTPDSDIVKKMKLKYGKNIGKFELDVGQGYKQTVTMKIFLWDHSQKIVISDIDGTITRSDILGQILNKWIHVGVTKLFNQIYKRHYKIIYLTARAIGQYQQTSKFLQTVQQNGVYLPQGPLMMSPDGYMRSFTREIIYKTPDYLKTKILASLNQVFPNTKNPIYCGFGNRETDSAAYLKINIAPDRIFCITDKSIISRQSDKEFNSTYIDILTNINDFFPEYFKDNEMVDSSDENVEEYHAVEGNEEAGKKTKSVDGDAGQANLEEFEEFLVMNKGRKSQHQIPQDDLNSLQQYMKPKVEQVTAQIYEQQISRSQSQTVKLTVQDPVTTIIQALATLADPTQPAQLQKQQQAKQQQVKPVLSQQAIADIMMKQLKEDNQVSEKDVIPNDDLKFDQRKSQASINSDDKDSLKKQASGSKEDKNKEI